MKRSCAWVGCNADAVTHGLCTTHVGTWPYKLYLGGANITERKVDGAGYIRARVGGVWALEHRLVATRMMNRLLVTSEIVWWRNGDKTDNDPTNLEIISRKEKAKREASARS